MLELLLEVFLELFELLLPEELELRLLELLLEVLELRLLEVFADVLDDEFELLAVCA